MSRYISLARYEIGYFLVKKSQFLELSDELKECIEIVSQDNPTGHSEREKTDRRRGGKTISKGGQERTLPAQLGQLKTEQDGKGLLQIHLWCPDDRPRLWDRNRKK